MQVQLQRGVERVGSAALDLQCVRERLESVQGLLAPMRRLDPVSQLVRGLIAARTDEAVVDAVLARLRQRFGRWEALAGARADEVLAVIAPVDGAAEKADRLPRGLTEVRRRLGALRLGHLAGLPLDAALDWLEELPGVGAAVAADVLNASTLDRPVMRVGGGFLRVARRLGWVEASAGAGAARDALTSAAPQAWTGEDFLALHRRVLRLTEAVCLPRRPACGACPLIHGCPEGRGRTTTPAYGVEPPALASLYRRVRRLERGVGPGPPSVGDAARVVSLGDPLLDAAFTARGLSAGLHQFAPANSGTLVATWLPAVAVAARAPSRGGVRLVLVQEADARREGGAPYGPGLEALGIAAVDLAVVRSRSALDALGAAEAAMRLHAAPVVMLELRRGEALADLAATRRLDLLARRAGAWLFLVTPTLDATSAALTRWRVDAAPSAGRRRRPGPPAVRLELVRNRAGRTGAWSLQWNPHERRFTPVAPLSAPVGAPALDRPRAPAAERVAAAA